MIRVLYDPETDRAIHVDGQGMVLRVVTLQKDQPLVSVVIEARIDATTCPGCRIAVPIGRKCGCPVQWIA